MNEENEVLEGRIICLGGIVGRGGVGEWWDLFDCYNREGVFLRAGLVFGLGFFLSFCLDVRVCICFRGIGVLGRVL